VAKNRVLSEEEIKQSTGARNASASGADRTSGASEGATRAEGGYEVQLDGQWIGVDYESYERVRAIQDSCA